MMKLTPEPIAAVGPAIAEPMPSATDDMRSVIDKLHVGDDGEEDDLGPFQGDDGEEDEEDTDEGQYDNSPAEPTDAPAFDADEYAHQENQPGTGNTSNGEKRQSNLPTATFESLMKEYKSFIGEASEEVVQSKGHPEGFEFPQDGRYGYAMGGGQGSYGGMGQFRSEGLSVYDKVSRKTVSIPDFTYMDEEPTQAMLKDIFHNPEGEPLDEEMDEAEENKEECECDTLGQKECPIHADDEPKNHYTHKGTNEKVDESTADILKLAGLK
jgi:hypothetical protein